MKHSLLLFALLLFINPFANSQSIENGVKLYQEGDYERALQVFDDIDEPVAYLFTGKSHFALGNYVKAKHHLSKVDSSYMEVFLEARYTKALADFQLKNYSSALDILYQIKESKNPASVRRTAISFYFQLLNYLTIDQRYQAFKSTSYDEVRLDLVKSAVGNVNLQTAKTLLNSYKNSVENPDETAIEQIERITSDSLNYSFDSDNYPEAPDGIAYNVGVALPQFDINSPNFAISQNLYFGIQLAFEEFNSENADKKAFITYKNTSASSATADSIVNEFVWDTGVDAILGPLFSEVAVQFSKLSEQYQIPLVTPLANADSLNLDRNYTYQLNPTLAVHGKTIAQFAVQNLGFDTLAVIVERGSIGEPSAIAFRNEATKLGAEIINYYSEDLESQGYDITEFTDFLNPETDTLTNYDIDAVYAPFTGEASSTLIESLLTHLEAMQSDITLLGSEAWQSIDLSSRNLPRSELYFTRAFSVTSDDAQIDTFNSAYRLRFDSDPDFYSMVGYDVANVLLETLKRVENPALLKEGLKEITNYEGLVAKVSFNGTHINQEVTVIKR